MAPSQDSILHHHSQFHRRCYSGLGSDRFKWCQSGFPSVLRHSNRCNLQKWGRESRGGQEPMDRRVYQLLPVHRHLPRYRLALRPDQQLDWTSWYNLHRCHLLILRSFWNGLHPALGSAGGHSSLVGHWNGPQRSHRPGVQCRECTHQCPRRARHVMATVDRIRHFPGHLR